MLSHLPVYYWFLRYHFNISIIVNIIENKVMKQTKKAPLVARGAPQSGEGINPRSLSPIISQSQQ